MNTLIKHELRANKKTLLIWLLCVGSICFACILLYTSLEDSMKGMAESFASMGTFAQAFGLDKLSIATLTGYYATEIGTIHTLGGAMFAAIIGTIILSKEEDAHTSEFLYSLPISRKKSVFGKWAALTINVVLFDVICALVYAAAFLALGESIETKSFVLFHLMQTLMHLEIGCICFLLSSCSRKNKIGAGLGIAILLYAVDMMARVIPAIEKLKYVTPFSYASAADIFSSGTIEVPSMILGIVIMIAVTAASFIVYEKRDLAS